MSTSVEREIARLLKRGVADEQRFLKRERQAEARFGVVQALVSREEERVARAQARLEKRQAELASALAELDERRSVRATGVPAEGN